MSVFTYPPVAVAAGYNNPTVPDDDSVIIEWEVHLTKLATPLASASSTMDGQVDTVLAAVPAVRAGVGYLLATGSAPVSPSGSTHTYDNAHTAALVLPSAASAGHNFLLSNKRTDWVVANQGLPVNDPTSSVPDTHVPPRGAALVVKAPTAGDWVVCPASGGENLAGYRNTYNFFLRGDLDPATAFIDITSTLDYAAGWYSVGPTGSLANAIYTELDVLPPGYKALLIGIDSSYTGAASSSVALVSRTPGSGRVASYEDPAAIVRVRAEVAAGGTYSVAETRQSWVLADTAGRFELARVEAAPVGSGHTVRLVVLGAQY